MHLSLEMYVFSGAPTFSFSPYFNPFFIPSLHLRSSIKRNLRCRRKKSGYDNDDDNDGDMTTMMKMTTMLTTMTTMLKTVT